MMRSSRPSAAAAARESHARALHADTLFAWSACAYDLRADVAAHSRSDHIIRHGFRNRAE
eukprot:147581-Lingulodinium_polyedra.AAC.1